MRNGFSPRPTDQYPTDKDGNRQILPMFPARTEAPTPAIVLVVGDTASAEMRWLVDELKTNLSTVRFVFLRSFANLANEFAEGEFPDMIVVLQNWSDEYSTTDRRPSPCLVSPRPDRTRMAIDSVQRERAAVTIIRFARRSLCRRPPPNFDCRRTAETSHRFARSWIQSLSSRTIGIRRAQR